MGSDNPSGAGNQQGSLEVGPVPISSIPQRLHAELLETDVAGLSAYLLLASPIATHGGGRLVAPEKASVD